MKALLPVAGNGTRMYPLGLTTPKCLVPILNKPLLQWSIESLTQNGITEIVLVINAGEFGQKIQDFVKQSFSKNVKITFATQQEQLGTAHVIQMAKDFFAKDEEFVFLYGDDLYGPANIAAVLQIKGLAVTGSPVKDPEKWGIFQTDEQNNLVQVVEKPEKPIGNLANIGCMKLNARVFEIFSQLKPSPRGEYELTESLNILAKETPIQVLQASDYWIPIGYPWHILEATELLAPKIESKIEGTVEENVQIKGKVVLPKSSTIKSGTYIEGNLVIGENTTLGPNAYIRGDTSVGNNCKVGFSVELKNSVVGNYTHIPHLSYIGDSVLGEHINFAGGSLVANFRHDGKTVQTPVKGQMVETHRVKFGTVIGDNVMLGAATKIYPGRKIWPGKTTLPGQIVDKDITE